MTNQLFRACACLVVLILGSFLFIVGCSTTAADKLNEKEMANIDPTLRSLITVQGKSTEAVPPLPRPVEVRDDGSSVYAVIIHTEDAESLKAAGIEVNSILPHFVTARITAGDLIRLARLESVTSVKPSEISTPDQR